MVSDIVRRTVKNSRLTLLVFGAKSSTTKGSLPVVVLWSSLNGRQTIRRIELASMPVVVEEAVLKSRKESVKEKSRKCACFVGT